MALNALSPRALDSRLLRWERRSKAYAQEAQDLIRSTPQHTPTTGRLRQNTPSTPPRATRTNTCGSDRRAVSPSWKSKRPVTGIRSRMHASESCMQVSSATASMRSWPPAVATTSEYDRSSPLPCRRAETAPCSNARRHGAQSTGARKHSATIREPTRPRPPGPHRGGVPERAFPSGTGSAAGKRTDRPRGRDEEYGWYR